VISGELHCQKEEKKNPLELSDRVELRAETLKKAKMTL
jgi:hypothetical protein